MYTYDDVKEHSNDKEYVEKAIEEDENFGKKEGSAKK